MRLALIALLAATPAFAAPDRVAPPLPADIVPVNCPPGLAKKNPPCVPPGQARSRGGLRVGDRFDGHFDRVDRGRFGLPPLRDGEAYVRVGDNILRVDRRERIILDIVDVILN